MLLKTPIFPNLFCRLCFLLLSLWNMIKKEFRLTVPFWEILQKDVILILRLYTSGNRNLKLLMKRLQKVLLFFIIILDSQKQQMDLQSMLKEISKSISIVGIIIFRNLLMKKSFLIIILITIKIFKTIMKILMNIQCINSEDLMIFLNMKIFQRKHNSILIRNLKLIKKRNTKYL